MGIRSINEPNTPDIPGTVPSPNDQTDPEAQVTPAGSTVYDSDGQVADNAPVQPTGN